ncbi:MAG: hypothetical protein GY778_09350 [bacterium]|nr:hypothetical protein [bacterium]
MADPMDGTVGRRPLTVVCFAVSSTRRQPSDIDRGCAGGLLADEPPWADLVTKGSAMNDSRFGIRFVASVLVVTLVGLCGCDGVPVVVGGGDGDVTVSAGVCSGEEPECPEGTFCKFDNGTCDNPLRVGACEAIPEACGEIFQPVCGCDDTTYANECEADVAGVAIATEGECPE